MTLLHGTELNIDPEGNVDWDADFLEGFDVCVASVHSLFNQSRDEMTRRIVRAMENPYVNVIGHPTGRMIGKRQPVDVISRRCSRRRRGPGRRWRSTPTRTGSTCGTSTSCGRGATA